ncbi:MFS general substrate transporter [Aspergillus coremiiformis]|uniref:MFS general substrate transporter n=1 Tax=Aspergillus coremiiformis TaxID=138285 RepID=A0A5N6ZJ00_9EURO|nr:MFS general substrate transporter [Aspergillus coremiiformis]
MGFGCLEQMKNAQSTNVTSKAAVQPSQQDRPSLLADIKQSPKVAGYCLALTSGILLYGYDLAIVANVSSMPEFQRDFGRQLDGHLIIPSLWMGLWNIANPIGGLFGALTGGYLQDRLGRRSTLAFASIISATGVAIAYSSNLPTDITSRRSVFFTAKLVLGYAVNMLMCTTQTYMSEILSPTLRGPLLAFFPLFTLLGQLLASIVVYTSLHHIGPRSYLTCFISEWPFSALPLLTSLLLPESPTWLIRKNRITAARHAQHRLDPRHTNPETTLSTLHSSIHHETPQDNPSYLDCWLGTHRRRTTIVLYASLIPQLFGLTLISKSSYFLQTINLDAENSLLILEIGIALGLVANITSIWTLSRFDRVTLLTAGFATSTTLWTGMGIWGCFQGAVTGWWSAVTIMLIVACCGATAWPASYAVGAETSALALRARSQGLGWVVNGVSNGVFGLVLPYVFNPDQGALGARTGFVYAGLGVVGLVVTWWIVPEMKDRSPVEIDRLFELRVPARRFKSWVLVGGHNAAF